MPVNLLLCEGAENSPDVRVLTKLLAGCCAVEPQGGRYGMGNIILARRSTTGSSTIAGLLDGDFQQEWTAPSHSPRPWTSGDKAIHFGWRWSRKEIENYLIDPRVVVQSLGPVAPPEQEYKGQLENAAEKLSTYQAARTALSGCRPRFRDLRSKWGQPRGRDRHQFPDDFSEPGCREGIESTVSAHAASQMVTVETAMERFEELLPEFNDGRVRRRDFLWTYAGKDLFLALEEALKRLGFASVAAFREKILLGIERTDRDIAEWIPEWSALRTAIDEYP